MIAQILELIGARDVFGSLVAFLLDNAIKGTLILLAAIVATALLRRASASLRHLCWAFAFAGLIALPLAAALVPSWRVPILPSVAKGAQDPQSIPPLANPDPFRADVDLARLVEGRSPVLASSLRTVPTNSSEASLRWPAIVLAIWGTGVLVVLARLMVGLIAIRNRGCRGTPICDRAWGELAAEIAERYRVRRPVVIRMAPQCTMPATWGLSRPILLLPESAQGWSADRIRAVLLHELAHVARWDFAVQTLARLACALHWFNPLVWLAEKRLRIEGEAASDDQVLRAGLSAPDYAAHLMSVLIAVRGARALPSAAMAMARTAGLERRLKAILDVNRPRRALSTRRILAITGVAGCLLGSLGIIRFEARAHEVPKLERLPEGVKIEVVGVSTHPAGPATWWGPDGTPLASAPCDPLPEDRPASGKQVREVVARVTGLPEGSTLQWHPTQCHSQGTSPPTKNGRPVPGLRRVIAEFTNDSPTCTLHFDLAVGPWTMEQAHGSTGIGSEKNGKAYYFGTARETKAGTAIAIAHTLADREVRVVAIDSDGREQFPRSTSWGGAGHVMMLEVVFELPPRQIREYQLQSRPIGRFEIKEVALRPRNITK